MTEGELVEILKEMLADATYGENVTATVHLFGILFNEEIKSSEVAGAQIARGVGKDIGSAITDGQKLAELGFVEPAWRMIAKWRGGMA